MCVRRGRSGRRTSIIAAKSKLFSGCGTMTTAASGDREWGTSQKSVRKLSLVAGEFSPGTTSTRSTVAATSPSGRRRSTCKLIKRNGRLLPSRRSSPTISISRRVHRLPAAAPRDR